MASQSNPPEAELELLYLDWCSTQVARRFLELSLDEVWLRSNVVEAASAEPLADASSDIPAAVRDRIPGYLELVRRTAVQLADEMELPTYSEWKAIYSANPSAFQIERLGR
jgi:hypothetical protein